MLKEIVGGQFMNLGYRTEKDYWKSLGGVGDTCTDCMVSYLAGQGYKTGTPKDQLIAWLRATQGAMYYKDAARKLVGYK
jgi:hypothetical protein